MSTTTTNYNLVKPDGNELYDVSVFNGNSDIIDNKMGELRTDVNSLSSSIRPISTGGTGASSASAARTNLGITPDNIGAVKKAGDTMSGDLKIQKEHYPNIELSNTTTGKSVSIIASDNNRAHIINRKDENNATWLALEDCETEDINNLIFLTLQLNNSSQYFKLFGQHNLSLLATAINTLIQNGSIHMIKSIQQGIVNTGNDSTGTIPVAVGTNLSNCVWTVNGSLGDKSFSIRKESSALHWYYSGPVSTLIPWEVIEYYV